MTFTSKRKDWIPWENCQKYFLKLFSNAFTWHELEDMIFYGQWTNLHDRFQNGPKLVSNAWIDWYLTFILHVNTNSIALWETLPNNADWDCFKTPILQDLLRTGWNIVHFFGIHSFVPHSWMCKKQTSVSHSSTESEIISLDAGLRLDWLPALESSDLIVSVSGSVSQISDRTGRPVNVDVKRNQKSPGKINVMEKIESCSLERPVLASNNFIVCVWRQWSSDQNDH